MSHLSSNFSHSLQRNGERVREKQKEREDVSLAGEREREREKDCLIIIASRKLSYDY